MSDVVTINGVPLPLGACLELRSVAACCRLCGLVQTYDIEVVVPASINLFRSASATLERQGWGVRALGAGDGGWFCPTCKGAVGATGREEKRP